MAAANSASPVLQTVARQPVKVGCQPPCRRTRHRTSAHRAHFVASLHVLPLVVVFGLGAVLWPLRPERAVPGYGHRAVCHRGLPPGAHQLARQLRPAPCRAEPLLQAAAKAQLAAYIPPWRGCLGSRRSTQSLDNSRPAGTGCRTRLRCCCQRTRPAALPGPPVATRRQPAARGGRSLQRSEAGRRAKGGSVWRWCGCQTGVWPPWCGPCKASSSGGGGGDRLPKPNLTLPPKPQISPPWSAYGGSWRQRLPQGRAQARARGPRRGVSPYGAGAEFS